MAILLESGDEIGSSNGPAFLDFDAPLERNGRKVAKKERATSTENAGLCEPGGGGPLKRLP